MKRQLAITPPAAMPATKRKLIDAAHSLVWANSYAQVSVDDICKAAGVQKGSFYHFFPTKADLAAAALEDHWLEIKDELEGIFSGNKDPREQLRVLCHAILEEQKEAVATTGMVCGCPYATLGAEIIGNSALHEICAKMSERFCSYFERLLKNAAKLGLIPKAGIARTAREMHIYTGGAMLEARLTNNLKSVGPDLHVALLRLSRMDAKPQKKRTKR